MITGYYDGNAVVTSQTFERDQKFILIPVDHKRKNSAAGSLHKYAKNAGDRSDGEILQEAAVTRYRDAL